MFCLTMFYGTRQGDVGRNISLIYCKGKIAMAKEKKSKPEDLGKLIDYIGELKDEIKHKQTLVEVNSKTLVDRLKSMPKAEGNAYVEGESYRARLTTRVTINYDAYKIDEKMDKQLTNGFIDKDYIISDIDKFISIMKKYKIKFKEVEDCLQINKKVNKANLEDMVKQELIGVKDLEGCYTISKSEYASIYKKKKKEE
jgi:hypothetical protein